METVNRNWKKHTYSFVFGAADASKDAAINPVLGIKGEVVKLVVVVPDWTNTVTTTVKMINGDTKEIFASSALAQDDEYDITLIEYECIIMGDSGEKWQLALSGVPGGTGGTATVTAYVVE